jgi:hypothetical protein
MRELGSFEALVKYHNDAQKTTGLNLTRVNANEYHCRPEQGKVAGRPLPYEIPLNSDATKELGTARYQKVQLPTFHEVMLAWDDYRIHANLQLADKSMFKVKISGCFNQLHWSTESVYLMGFHLTCNIYNHDHVNVRIRRGRHSYGLEPNRRRAK